MGSPHMHKTLRVQYPYDDHVLIGQSAQWHTPHCWSFPCCAACGMLGGTPSALIWQHVATGFNVVTAEFAICALADDVTVRDFV
jgi:hypothetical protein